MVHVLDGQTWVKSLLLLILFECFFIKLEFKINVLLVGVEGLVDLTPDVSVQEPVLVLAHVVVDYNVCEGVWEVSCMHPDTTVLAHLRLDFFLIILFLFVRGLL